MNATTEFAREGLKTKLDRRWVSCGNPNMCPAMASVVPQEVQEQAAQRTLGELMSAREWLRTQLQRFTGPPNMELRVLDDDEIESRADYFAILLRIPMPDSNGSGDWFPVGRLGYSLAATRWGSPLVLKAEVHELMKALALHEVKEWLRWDGEHVMNPHPELS